MADITATTNPASGAVWTITPEASSVQTVTPATNAVTTTIDLAHKKIHDGTSYTISRIFAAVANDGYADIRIVHPTAQLHIVPTVVSTAKANATILVGQSYTAGAGQGTAMTPYNRNRNSANTSTATPFYTPTLTTPNGTTISTSLINGTTGPQAVGGTMNERLEIITKPTEDFLIRVQNKSGSAADIEIQLDWYEV